MLALKDIRQYISGLGIAVDNNVYIGKMDSKNQRSIGVYSRPTSGLANIAIGGSGTGLMVPGSWLRTHGTNIMKLGITLDQTVLCVLRSLWKTQERSTRLIKTEK